MADYDTEHYHCDIATVDLLKSLDTPGGKRMCTTLGTLGREVYVYHARHSWREVYVYHARYSWEGSVCIPRIYFLPLAPNC